MTTPPPRPPSVVSLRDARRYGPAVVGSKAHALSVLAAAGLAVPDGFVITTAALDAWPALTPQIRAAARRLGAARYAVRSSAVAEDLACASFAGQYDTVLDVGGEDLPAAARRVVASARGQRVASYRSAPGGGAMAVLVQVMVAADAAGVAFSANPLTGRRDEVLVSAVRGAGERLVSGAAAGDEWAVRGRDALRNRSTEDAIDGDGARAVAALARRVEQRMGGPQDIEWARAGGALWLLQARPMTALPDAPAWPAPGPGRWQRNFRIGEWLPDPVTPLFATWLLERMEEGLHDAMRATAGAVLPFRHATINGWYYTALPHPPVRRIAGALVRSRGRIVPFARDALLTVTRRPELADRRLLGELARRWRDQHLPSYEASVARAHAAAAGADAAQLMRIVDDLGREAGTQLWWLELLGGAAWKIEACLASFVTRHLRGVFDGGVQVLTSGLDGLTRTAGDVGDHAVQSLDWYHPTRGEMTATAGPAPPDPAVVTRRDRVVQRRRQAQDASRRALAGTPALRRRFDVLLEVAQRYAGLREEQAQQLTLAWPVLRRCALALGAQMHARGVITATDDVFFLTAAELRDRADHRGDVQRRREAWQRQRRLVPPLTVGTLHRLLPDVVGTAVTKIAGHGRPPAHAIVGQPASPGRATGAVRVVHDPADAAALQPGEVLVARATAPAWTPLFARAAAVVTDGGTLAAHASLVAREYGIPAVVATGDATTRLRDGQVVTVDGTTGAVET